MIYLPLKLTRTKKTQKQSSTANTEKQAWKKHLKKLSINKTAKEYTSEWRESHDEEMDSAPSIQEYIWYKKNKNPWFLRYAYVMN